MKSGSKLLEKSFNNMLDELIKSLEQRMYPSDTEEARLKRHFLSVIYKVVLQKPQPGMQLESLAAIMKAITFDPMNIKL